MALTAAQLSRLKRMAGESHKTTPMLSESVLQEIADEAALIVDDEGLAPTHDDYTSTYDLYVAAAECWRTKAGMVAEGYDFTAEGVMMTRSQMYQHYLEQASRYASLASQLSPNIGSTRLPG